MCKCYRWIFRRWRLRRYKFFTDSLLQNEVKFVNRLGKTRLKILCEGRLVHYDATFEKLVDVRKPTSLFRSLFDYELVKKLRMRKITKKIKTCSNFAFSRIKMYWRRSKDSSNELVFQAIARNIFEFILSNTLCQDNNFLDPIDKFAKVRPLNEMITERKKCNSNWTAPNCEIL